jgi:integrase
VWKLTVNAGRYEDGSPRRLHRTVHADTAVDAAHELAAFVAEAQSNPQLDHKADRDITVDDLMYQYLTEHLRGDKGRELRTVEDYRRLHAKWFSPEIGSRWVRDVDEDTMDRIFGRMRRAGLSHARMHHAKSIYTPFFRWAKRRRIITRNPMADFDLPTSRYVSRERVPPEVSQLCLLLETAVKLVPDVAPILALGAVTGMRRGELVAIRRNRLSPADGVLKIDTATDGVRVKTTKTRVERNVSVDDETMDMLLTHCAEMDARAETCGVEVPPDAFVFSLQPDCSKPMPPDYVTKRVAILKDHLGIADKKPATIALEDKALALYRKKPKKRPTGKTGPYPTGGMTYIEIGKTLGRSAKWASLAVASAQRREAGSAEGRPEMFDGSILALRKFTSSELLDAGFNISAVAKRQGHGPQVLVKHYAKGRRTADRKAAEHLGRVVHGRR